MTFYSRAPNSLDVEQRILTCLSMDSAIRKDDEFQLHMNTMLKLGSLDPSRRTYRIEVNVEEME